MTNILSTLKFIIQHPLNRQNKIQALLRFIKWQINALINPFPIIYSFTENSKLVIWKGLTGATGNLYCGLHDADDMGFLLHLLREADTFVDIGANIGSYTILASAEIHAYTIAVEPVPETFKNLTQNIAINQIAHLVEPLNIGLGSHKSILKFTKSLDTVNHVATSEELNTIAVVVDTLDNVIGNKKPILLKIDVEGFETEVLKGATLILENECLKAIIIELNGAGETYGYDENNIHKLLLSKKFYPYSYNSLHKNLTKRDSFGKFNTIYIRDLEFVIQRIQTSRQIRGSGFCL